MTTDARVFGDDRMQWGGWCTESKVNGPKTLHCGMPNYNRTGCNLELKAATV